jgi:hypothetical protein
VDINDSKNRGRLQEPVEIENRRPEQDLRTRRQAYAGKADALKGTASSPPSSFASFPEPFHFTKACLETGLFEVESAKLIWEATSAINNPDSLDEAIKDFTKAVIQQLEVGGYIPR